MKKIRKRVSKDWHFLVLSLATVLVGINFLLNPDLLDDHSAYAFIVNVIDDAVFSIPILIIGLIGTVMFFVGNCRLRSLTLVVYQFIWMVVFLAYWWRAINGLPNSSWIMALMINIVIFCVALWGDVDGW